MAKFYTLFPLSQGGSNGLKGVKMGRFSRLNNTSAECREFAGLYSLEYNLVVSAL